jgi:hypothetical protein
MMTLGTIRGFFGEFRAADLVASGLELAFILVILWLELPERFHKRRIRKQLAMIQRIMFDGHDFRDSVASANANDEAASRWIKSVQAWIDSTYHSIAATSLAAALAFMHRNVAPDIHYGGVTSRTDVSKQFQELLIRLDNLQNIMEKAGVYF